MYIHVYTCLADTHTSLDASSSQQFQDKSVTPPPTPPTPAVLHVHYVGSRATGIVETTQSGRAGHWGREEAAADSSCITTPISVTDAAPSDHPAA